MMKGKGKVRQIVNISWRFLYVKLTESLYKMNTFKRINTIINFVQMQVVLDIWLARHYLQADM